MIPKEIPVVIAHFGTKPNYLKLALKSAARFNQKVVLIGDEANKDVWIDHWDTKPSEIGKFQEFLKSYTHMSSFSQEYEISCFKRMFAMEVWMKQNGLKEAFHLDSDIMTFANYSKEILPILPNGCMATLMAVEKEQHDYLWVKSCHFSYWTIEALEDYTNFCIQAYRDSKIRNMLEAKWKWHCDHHKGGGICDMTVLYFWAKGNPHILYMTKVHNGLTADHNFNQSAQYYDHEYQMEFGLKKFVFKEGLPYGYNQLAKQWIRFLCVHCQGAGKCTMPFLSNDYLRSYYVVSRIYHRIKSKYLRFSFRKFKKLIEKNKKK